MNAAQEQKTIMREFNGLTTRRTRQHLIMAIHLYQVNGMQCALDFIAKMKEYERSQIESRATIIQVLEHRIKNEVRV